METTATALDIVKEALEALAAGDQVKLSNLLAEDVTYSDSTLYLYKPEFQGREQVLDLLFAMCQPYSDEHVQFVDIVTTEDKVGVEAIYTATHTGEFAVPGVDLPSFPATGKQVTYPAFTIYTIKNGKITRGATYYDGMTILAQEGLLPQAVPGPT